MTESNIPKHASAPNRTMKESAVENDPHLSTMLPLPESDEITDPLQVEPLPVSADDSCQCPAGYSCGRNCAGHAAKRELIARALKAPPPPPPTLPGPQYALGPEKDVYRDVAAAVFGPEGHPTPATPKPGDPAWKDNNPKDAFGALKVDYTTYLWMPVLYQMSIGMAAGAFKYGAHNYLAIAPSAMTYVGATKRHLDAFVGGEMFDPNAGPDIELTHVIAAMNSLHVLAAAIINKKWIDDRPPAMPAGFIDDLHKQMAVLKRNNPDPVARYLSDGRRGPGRVVAAKPEEPK